MTNRFKNSAAPQRLSRLCHSAVSVLFAQNNVCHLCGRALLYANEAVLCDPCQRELALGRIPAVEAAVSGHEPLRICVSAYWHQDEARRLVHLLKYQGDRTAAQPLGVGMSAALCEAAHAGLYRCDLIVPVPLHPKRERTRGYNQAFLLAHEVHLHTGIPLLPNVLARMQAARTQVRKTRDERLSDMKGAFSAADSAALAGRRALLIDDVLTTGATAVSCANALILAGVDEVCLLTACRA